MDWHPVNTKAIAVKDSSDVTETQPTIMTNPDGSSGLGIPAYKPESSASDDEINTVRERFVRNNLEMLLAFREALSDVNLPRTMEEMRLLTPEAQVSKWDKNNVIFFLLLDFLYFLVHFVLSFLGILSIAAFTDMLDGGSHDESEEGPSTVSSVAFFVALIISQLIICSGGIYSVHIRNVYGMNVYLLCQVVITIVFLRGASWVMLIVRPITMIMMLRYRAITLRCETVLRRRFSTLDEQLVQRRRLASQIDNLLNTVFANDPHVLDSIRGTSATSTAMAMISRGNSRRAVAPARSLNGSLSNLIEIFNQEANETLQRRSRVNTPTAPLTIVAASGPGTSDYPQPTGASIMEAERENVFSSGTTSSMESAYADRSTVTSGGDWGDHDSVLASETFSSAYASTADSIASDTSVTRPGSAIGTGTAAANSLSTTSARLVTSAVSTLQRLLSNAQRADSIASVTSTTVTDDTAATATEIQRDAAPPMTVVQAADNRRHPTQTRALTGADAHPGEETGISATFVTANDFTPGTASSIHRTTSNAGVDRTDTSAAMRSMGGDASSVRSSTDTNVSLPRLASLSDAATNLFQRALSLSRRTIDYISEEVASPRWITTEESVSSSRNRTTTPRTATATAGGTTPAANTPSTQYASMEMVSLPGTVPESDVPSISPSSSSTPGKSDFRRTSLEVSVLPRALKAGGVSRGSTESDTAASVSLMVGMNEEPGTRTEHTNPTSRMDSTYSSASIASHTSGASAAGSALPSIAAFSPFLSSFSSSSSTTPVYDANPKTPSESLSVLRESNDAQVSSEERTDRVVLTIDPGPHSSGPDMDTKE